LEFPVLSDTLRSGDIGRLLLVPLKSS